MLIDKGKKKCFEDISGVALVNWKILSKKKYFICSWTEKKTSNMEIVRSSRVQKTLKPLSLNSFQCDSLSDSMITKKREKKTNRAINYTFDSL